MDIFWGAEEIESIIYFTRCAPSVLSKGKEENSLDFELVVEVENVGSSKSGGGMSSMMSRMSVAAGNILGEEKSGGVAVKSVAEKEKPSGLLVISLGCASLAGKPLDDWISCKVAI
jgi:hypothetical protein